MFSSFDPVYNILEQESIFDTLGFLAPFLLFGFTVWNLRTQTYYLGAYVIGWFANSLLNHILKQTIKEPRPTTNKALGHTKALGYGMPSAHTQSCFFSITYLYAIKRSTAFLIGELFLGALTFYQRWKTKMHTVEQLGLGSVVGIGFALFVYYLTYRYLHDYRDNPK
jgi:hypothetical protein